MVALKVYLRRVMSLGPCLLNDICTKKCANKKSDGRKRGNSPFLPMQKLTYSGSGHLTTPDGSAMISGDKRAYYKNFYIEYSLFIFLIRSIHRLDSAPTVTVVIAANISLSFRNASPEIRFVMLRSKRFSGSFSLSLASPAICKR